MNKRRALSIAVIGLFSCLLLVFVWIFLRGLDYRSSVNDERNENAGHVFSGVEPGQVVLHRHKTTLLWLVHLNDKQIRQMKELDGLVINKDIGCNPKGVFCALDSATSRDGINLQYTAAAPPQLSVKTPWFGGFVDPVSGSIYDLIGRGYQQNKDRSMAAIKVHHVD